MSWSYSLELLLRTGKIGSKSALYVLIKKKNHYTYIHELYLYSNFRVAWKAIIFENINTASIKEEKN